MQKVLVLIGTRPNFIKVSQFKEVAQKNGINLRLVHTGQHYDYQMSGVFFDQFNLEPNHFLEITKGISANQQFGNIILKLDEYISKTFKPDLVLVVGDVNSTLAGALVANKLGIPIGHIESGLRSRDEGMPEEINRILTDRITNYFFITEQSGYDNLLQEGVKKDAIHFVGNTMIDTLVAFGNEIEASNILKEHGLGPQKYELLTATEDHQGGLEKLLQIVKYITQNRILVFPIHPRTKKRFQEFSLEKELEGLNNLILTPPLGYFEFQKLIKYAKYIVTDSGGIQEESTYRKVPCITLRPNTERPSTIEIGSNTLSSFDKEKVIDLIDQIEQGTYKQGQIPPLWDGKATERIFEVISELPL